MGFIARFAGPISEENQGETVCIQFIVDLPPLANVGQIEIDSNSAGNCYQQKALPALAISR